MSLLGWLHRHWLRHEARNLAAALHHEELRHREYAVRIAFWTAQLARVKAELAHLERPPVRLASRLLAGSMNRREIPAKMRFVSARSETPQLRRTLRAIGRCAPR